LARLGGYIVDYPCICISVVKQTVLFSNRIQNEQNMCIFNGNNYNEISSDLFCNGSWLW